MEAPGIKPTEINLNPISQIDPVVIVVVALILVVTYLLLRRVYVLPYLDVMETREERFSVARQQSAQAAEVRRSSDLQAEAILTEAAAASEGIRNAAAARAEAYRKERLAEASQRSSESLESGRAELRAVRERELASVQTQAIECVAAACEQLLGGADAEAVESTVVRLMESKAH
jgi:F0F1-type ATP synthase membrane subunit b/b'